jgi:hypothetical protein
MKMAAASGAVSSTKARKLIREHLGIYAADEFDRVTAEILWKVSRGGL